MKQQTLLSGNIKKQLITLAIPLIFGNILQQLYNTADSLIVGHFLGTDAFASVGVSGSIMNLFIFVLNGFCVGISVILGQLYGKEDRAAELTDYLKNIQKDLDDRTKDIPDSEKPSVYVGGVSFDGIPYSFIYAENLVDRLYLNK